MSTEHLRNFFLSYLAVSNQHNVTEMQKFYNDPISINGVPTTPQQVTDGFAALWEGFNDWSWNAVQIVIEDNAIAVRYNQTGVQTGTYMGIPATGRAVSAPEFDFYTVEDDKIVSVNDLKDDQTIIDQISN